MSRSLFLQPIDVWLFRDGKPFDAGSDHHAESIFPPMPSVIQGALRSHYLVMQGVGLSRTNSQQIKSTVGTATDYLDLALRGPFLRRGEEVFFALPMDVVRGQDGLFYPMRLADVPRGCTSACAPRVLMPPEDIKPAKFDPSGWWVSQAEMATYTAGKPFHAVQSDELFHREIRYGIARDNKKRVVVEGALYQAEHIRLCEDVGLHVEILSGLANWNQKAGAMRIGGEGHGARFVEKPLTRPIPEPAIVAERFKLTLITPACFEQGWRPGDWNALFDGGKVTLEAAAIGRYITMGGYDLAGNMHKPSLRYVPAGSVYYFSAQDKVKLKHGWLCDALDNVPLGRVGYGQVIVSAY